MEDFAEEIENALDLCYKLDELSPKKSNLLDKGRTVYLHIVIFKLPYAPPRKRKFLNLRHSLYGDDPEICLFVPNRKTGVEYKKTTDELIDYCVDYYTELLQKHKVKGITTIMPLKQLRSEYGTYELKRKLVRRFDLFLCKNSLLYNPRFLTSLGKTFQVAKKDPMGVPFPKKDVDFDPEFQKNVERAKFTSSFYITPFSDNYTIPFGNLSNTKNELKENLETVLNQLLTKKIIPGGLKNIRTMHLWPSQLKPIPIYFSKELPVDMKKPHVSYKRKRRKAVEGELSTQPGKKVFVMPNGDVFVTKADNNESEPELESEDEDSFKDESDDNDEEEEEEEEKEKGGRQGKKNYSTKVKNPTMNEEESDSEDDEEIEKKEAELLLKFSKNQYGK